MAETKKYNLVVIGAGPGGYAAAFHAADLGLKVALIDTKPEPGGVCLFEGCIPSKALLHLAHVKEEALRSKDIGLSFSNPEINIKKVANWKNKVVRGLTGGLLKLSKARKINYIQGKAQFKGTHKLSVKLADKKDRMPVAFEHCIIATGSVSAGLPFADMNNKRIMDAAQALEVKDIPDSMLVIGGGYIGLEMGTVYSALGTKVTVAEMGESLLPGVDEDLVNEFLKANQKRFKKVYTGTKVTAIDQERSSKFRVTLQTQQDTEQIKVDKVLVAIGRKPNTNGLNLEAVGIEIDEKGFIKIDNKQKTNIRNIFAIGDVAREPMLAHKATYEGKIAAEVIAKNNGAHFNPAAIPAVVFTDPEIAWCGLTEIEAREIGRHLKILRFPWNASGRAATVNDQHGLTKMIVDPANERILGVGIAGRNAGDLIAEAVVAIEMGTKADDLSMSIHPHPTFSESVMETAESLYGHSTHFMGR